MFSETALTSTESASLGKAFFNRSDTSSHCSRFFQMFSSLRRGGSVRSVAQRQTSQMQSVEAATTSCLLACLAAQPAQRLADYCSEKKGAARESDASCRTPSAAVW